ncbi:BlaI/MecI/CopY family transcriptional regulator [Draconibacterium sp. IB214405]|uniref:BlaI/MecI/CopY family transcriptional regulator n=1 Tax=Draconibacterium sp. IB214405 TaxID=3097352 RepID=UPI002A11B9C8|nr:BlaI/MecI/CopY family transcriptional regulator [Draconibacterium sp. IB214405]MDX8338610.1 BlaI/MecI/CopY family transcriptional regulator [Draconibacterium sp. IB214405]
MKKLTPKEEEILSLFWEKGPMFVKELKELYSDQKLHYNTLSTMVRALEEKGFLNHEQFGNTHRYFAVVSKEDYSKGTLGNVVKKYFNNSYKNVVSLLVEEENLSVEDLKKLIEEIENQQNDSQ